MALKGQHLSWTQGATLLDLPKDFSLVGKSQQALVSWGHAMTKRKSLCHDYTGNQLRYV